MPLVRRKPSVVNSVRLFVSLKYYTSHLTNFDVFVALFGLQNVCVSEEHPPRGNCAGSMKDANIIHLFRRSVRLFRFPFQIIM